MKPALVDTHCHLLAGLDDGPRNEEDALTMCDIAFAEGTRTICAVAHQNERYCDVTPECIRTATQRLAEQLRQRGSELTVVPCAEVMVWPDLEPAWSRGPFAQRRRYRQVSADRTAARSVRRFDRLDVSLDGDGGAPILAHPERQPEFLDDVSLIEALVEVGLSGAGVVRQRDGAAQVVEQRPAERLVSPRSGSPAGVRRPFAAAPPAADGGGV